MRFDIFFFIILASAITYLLVNTYYVKITENEILADVKRSFSFVHISDIHSTMNFLNGNLIKIINKLTPDFVVVTGDLSNTRKQLPEVLNGLSNLSAKRVFIVLGNYEGQEIRGLHKRNTDINKSIELIREHKELTLLKNEHSLFELRGNRVLIYGFDNSTYGKEKYDKEVDSFDYDYKILLAHSPNIVKVIEKNNITCNQILTGHTHGGQIRICNNSHLGIYKDFHIGVKKYNKALFCISRGIGTVRIPFRINCFPEISLYRVKAGKQL